MSIQEHNIFKYITHIYNSMGISLKKDIDTFGTVFFYPHWAHVMRPYGSNGKQPWQHRFLHAAKAVCPHASAISSSALLLRPSLLPWNCNVFDSSAYKIQENKITERSWSPCCTRICFTRLCPSSSVSEPNGCQRPSGRFSFAKIWSPHANGIKSPGSMAFARLSGLQSAH